VILIESDICGRRTGCSRTKEDVGYHASSLQIFNIDFQRSGVLPVRRSLSILAVFKLNGRFNENNLARRTQKLQGYLIVWFSDAMVL
jgi:hypothetical protein